MTVSTINSVAEFATNGITKSFPFYFKFLDSRDLVVTYIDPDGIATILTMGTQYTVSGAGNDKGGSISTTIALLGPGKLIVSRDMEAYQQTSLRNQGKFLAETHEDVFDKLTMLSQQGFAVIKRALSRPFGREYFDAEGRRITDVANPKGAQDAATKSYADSAAAGAISYADAKMLHTVRSANGETLTQLPPAASRANKVMGFDAAGQPIGVLPASGSGTELAADLANVIDPYKGAGMVASEQGLMAPSGTVSARLNDAFPAGYGVPAGAAVHIIAGIDSLSAGAGGGSYATALADDLRSVYGDHGPGFVPTDASVTGTGFWGSASASQVADLPDSDIRRKMSFNFGGFYYDLMSAGQQTAWGPRRDWENIRLFFLKSPDGGKFKVDHGNVNSSTYRYEVDTYSPTYELGYIDITKRPEGTQDLLFLAGSVGAPGSYGKVCVYGGLITRQGAGPQVIVSRHAKGGYTVQQFVDILDDATQRQWFSLLGPTIYALNGGTNDAGQPSPLTPAALRVKMEALLARLPIGTLKVIVAPNYHSGDVYNVMPTYRSMIRQLSIDNGYGYINFAAVLGTSARATTLGLMLDATHPSQSGNKVLARAAGSYLGAAPALVRTPVTPFVIASEGGGFPTVFRYVELTRKNLDRASAGAVVLYDLGLISGFPIGMLDVQVTANRQDSLSVISQRLTARIRGGVAGSENLATCGTPTIVSILSDVQGATPLTVALSLTQAGGRVQVVATCATGGAPDTYTNLCASGSVTLTQNVKTGKGVFEN